MRISKSISTYQVFPWCKNYAYTEAVQNSRRLSSAGADVVLAWEAKACLPCDGAGVHQVEAAERTAGNKQAATINSSTSRRRNHAQRHTEVQVTEERWLAYPKQPQRPAETEPLLLGPQQSGGVSSGSQAGKMQRRVRASA